MRREVDNRNKDCEFHGDYVGRDLNVTNIIMFRDSEREFVVTHNADIKSVTYFTGREKELEDLRQRIEEGRKSVLVSGMGGIGKTHICRKLYEEYTQKHADGENIPFCHIGYIEYDGNMGNSIWNCLKYKKQDNPEQNHEAAWQELEHLAADGKLLLFVDNVNVSIGEDAGLGRLKQIPGAVVLTSRRTSFSKEFEPYRIGFLSTEQCIVIYERIRYGGSGKRMPEEEISDLEYVIEEMAAWHTITVEFLAHLAETKQLTAKELRIELEAKGFRLKYRNEEDKLINIQEEYEKLYDLSILTEAEKNILEAFSIFPYIPLEANICNRWLLEDARVSKDDDVLIGLYRKGWLQFDLGQACYAMHPVFAKFIYEKCKPQLKDHCRLIEECQKCLEISESGSIIERQKFVPFAETMLIKLNMGQSLERACFIYVFACLLLNIAEYQKAEVLFKESLEISKEELGEKHPDTAICYNNLADTYFRQGKYDVAEDLFVKGLEINRIAYKEIHSETASSYSNLARLHYKKGKYEAAEELFEKSLEIRKIVRGENHLDTAINFNNLAGTYWKQGKYGKAVRLFKKGLQIQKNILGEDDIGVVAGYDNMAMVYKWQEDYREAEELYKKSMYIRERKIGRNHPDTAIIYNNLADLLRRQGKHEEELLFYVNAYKIMLSRLGLNHSNTKLVYKNTQAAFVKSYPEGNFEQWLEEKMKELDYSS